MTKITSLEIENVKRIKAVSIAPSENGLTIIGGKNNQGKTSVLDSIAWALGGEKYRPSTPNREGSVIPPKLHVTLSNGLVVERKGKNSELKVIDPSGNKAGQQLINEFVSALALDLPKFMEASGKEKAKTLLQIIGVGDRLFDLEHNEQTLYNQRLAIGRIADQKAKHAAEMVSYDDAPDEPISVSELIRQQQSILAKNGENARLRQRAAEIWQKRRDMEQRMQEMAEQYTAICRETEIADRDAADLYDESTAEIEASIANIEAINARVMANAEKCRAEDEAEEYRSQYADLTRQIEDVRRQKMELLNDAQLPLAGLSVEEGELTYNGYKWDGMSGSDQLKVATAIVRKINPQCGFVLLDKLEQMDTDTLREFGAWLESEGLQAIATRVSTGEECSILIEDGYAVDKSPETEQKKWKAGEF